ncbi:50S ribosomal protein L5 [Sulfolobales archaeon HS-7]|nr:50S ribosomal protein L5 [Sulfolobales archaeon HS-7]
MTEEQTFAQRKKNPMRRVLLDKVTVNIGVGETSEKLQKAYMLLQEITGSKPVYTKAKKTIRDFGVRKGTNIGVKVTLRGEKAVEFLRKALEAIGYRLKENSFDNYGNVGFGIIEHVSIPGTRYDPEVGMFGMDVIITLARPGYRVSSRRRNRSRVPRRHKVSKEEAIEFLREEFGVTIVSG